MCCMMLLMIIECQLRTSKNYERICLNKKKYNNLAFGQVGDKNYAKDCCSI